ncbi:ATP-binding protein [Pseudobacter ginsenosidimutans]|uniref:ATP-dependent DNA helicase RecG n=1 Tax=Pseudobacter ginsenosidimutans TaxID=661488 RepID=A0A4Q7MYW3_9BACT|nr:ATP-binding protein [Pseudobacter ginsenosidimutans]RZS72360.1 ATP-dependent DNA helicase RecG [Pseudobacter ginsenosidimutans]
MCLANAQGGKIFIGIEDKDKTPPADQALNDELVNNTITRLRTLCFNVGLTCSTIETHKSGGQFFSIEVHATSKSLATTSDGKIFIRVGDQCQPARNEDIQRLVGEKNAFNWELHPTQFLVAEIPAHNLEWFSREIKSSKRVIHNIKDLSNIEIAEHYHLVDKNRLTNLGILWLGTPYQRSRLTYPLTIQYIVYDETENKVRKLDWHDQRLNPKDVLLDIEQKAIELTYFDEIPQGLFRKQIRHYDEKLIRELLINAIAHKDFTISGDIFIKVFKDRLEITNPGGLPLGINKSNILHSTNRRNPYLIRILHDLELMEGEGTGYNLMYEIASRDGKAFPLPETDFNTTRVIQSSEIQNEESIQLIEYIAGHFELSQKEFIVLGIVIRNGKISSVHLTEELQLSEEERIRSYVSKLVDHSILISRGVKKGREYLINPKLIADSKINIKPTLKIIEQPRLIALIEETLKLHSILSIQELFARLVDVPIEDIRKAVYKMIKHGTIAQEGGKKNRKYKMAKKK